MSILNFFRKKKNTVPESRQHMQLVQGNGATVSHYLASPESSDVVIACVDAISRNIGKLRGSHTIAGKPVDDGLTRLLQGKPNQLMSAYDLLYKISAYFFLRNNAFLYIARTTNEIEELLPIDYVSCQFMQSEAAEIYVQFTLIDGQKVTLPYSDVVHLRRHYMTNSLIGSSNRPIDPAIAVAAAQNDGILQSIKSGASLRGILKFSQLTSEQMLKNEAEKFRQNFLSVENSGGIITLDAKTDFQPLELHSQPIDIQQTEAISEKIYSYFGVTKEIVTSNFSEDQHGAFYESVVEPFSLQLSLELTNKCFTDRERAFGHNIVFEAGRLQYASSKTKIRLIKELLPTGLLTINQALEILNLPTVQDGDRRLQSLNFIDQKLASKYQMFKVHSDVKEGANDERD